MNQYHSGPFGIPWFIWGVGAYLWYTGRSAALIPGTIPAPGTLPSIPMYPGGNASGPPHADISSLVQSASSIWAGPAGSSPPPAGAVNGYGNVVAFQYDGYGRRRR